MHLAVKIVGLVVKYEIHTTADVSAAIKLFHVVWRYQEEFKDEIIHLRDFHAIMEFVGNIAKLFEAVALKRSFMKLDCAKLVESEVY